MRVNVRLVAATNRDIVQAIAGGEFREDLFHRLNVVQLLLPPLRERGEDILLLAEHFLKSFAGSMNRSVKRTSPSARQKLLAHHWPGNVRELRNVIERALILERGAEVQSGSLPDFQLEARLHKTESPRPAGDGPLDEVVADFERNLINTTLEQNNFNLSKSAERLRISRHALRYRMQRLSIALPTDTEDDAPATAGKEANE
jgi:DNA-binding NtrC family response regulator